MAKAGTEIDFGSLARDPTNYPLPFATKFGTKDSSGTPKLSPLNYSSSIITLVVPNDAVWFSVSPTTDLRVSEDPAMASYDVVPTAGRESFYVALMANVYIVWDSADGIARFKFMRV